MQKNTAQALIAALDAGSQDWWLTKATAFLEKASELGDGAVRAFITRADTLGKDSDKYYAACGKYLREIAQGTSSDTAAAVALTENGYAALNPYDPRPKGPGVVGAFKDSYRKARGGARSRAVRPTASGTGRRVGL